MILNGFLSWRRRRAARMPALSHDTLAGAASPASDLTAHLAERDARGSGVRERPSFAV